MKDKKKKGRSRMFGRSSKYIGVGCHIDEIEAAKNYDHIAFTKYGIRDRLNFPEDWMPLTKPPEE